MLTPKAEEDKGTDGKASNTKVEFDPMGAYKAIAYYTVKTNDTNTSGAFGTWNDSLPEGEEWQSENSRIWPFRQTSRSLFPTTFRRLSAKPCSSWFITEVR
ncbi:MAG: hypothetical protein ACLTXT_02620 [Ruminococcus callidus]